MYTLTPKSVSLFFASETEPLIVNFSWEYEKFIKKIAAIIETNLIDVEKNVIYTIY